MTTPLQQMTAISAQLSVDLSTVTDDRLIELCLLYRSEPDAYRAFADNLKEEIIRRFTAEEIVSNDVMFSVIKNFSNQFSSTIPYFAKKILEMAASVNRDIWFIDNLVMMQTFASDLDAMNWLVEPKQADVLAKVLNNTYGLKVIANSLVASTAVLSHQPSVDIWKAVPFLWDTGFWVSYKNGMDVLSKSSELASYVAASSTAMTAVIASSTAMTAVIASSTALSAIVKSTSARNALMSNNTVFQSVKAQIYNTVKASWSKQASVTNVGNSSQIQAMTAAVANPVGIVLAQVFIFDNSGSYAQKVTHSNGVVALNVTRFAGSNAPSSLSVIDVISFNGVVFTGTDSGAYGYAELWKPPA